MSVTCSSAGWLLYFTVQNLLFSKIVDGTITQILKVESDFINITTTPSMYHNVVLSIIVHSSHFLCVELRIYGCFLSGKVICQCFPRLIPF